VSAGGAQSRPDPNVHTRDCLTDENPPAVDDANEEPLGRELDALLAEARSGDLAPPEFSARLEQLHSRFLGRNAQTPEMIERRRSAAAAYDDLWSGEDLDTHHNLECLAASLGIDLPPAS
jgi:hypothetical protein